MLLSLFVACLVGYAWNLGLPDIGGDAAKYALNIGYPHPPLIRSLMWASQALFGFTPFFARLPVVLLGAATVALLFVLFRRLRLSLPVALALTLAFAVQPEWIRWMRYGYLSSTLIFFWTLAFLGLARLTDDPQDRRGPWLLFFGFVGGFWSQLQGMLFLPVYLFAYARKESRHGHTIWLLGLAQVVLFFLYIATSPLIVGVILSYAKAL